MTYIAFCCKSSHTILLLIHQLADTHLAWILILAIVNKAAIDMGMQPPPLVVTAFIISFIFPYIYVQIDCVCVYVCT